MGAFLTGGAGSGDSGFIARFLVLVGSVTVAGLFADGSSCSVGRGFSLSSSGLSLPKYRCLHCTAEIPMDTCYCQLHTLGNTVNAILSQKPGSSGSAPG